jgi:hypothetical protein
MIGGQPETLVQVHDRHRVNLAVRRIEVIAGAEEAAGLADVGCQRAAPLVLEQRDVLRCLRGEQRFGVGEVADPDVDVILEVLPDRQVSPGLDAVGLQFRGHADAGQHQQLRGVVGACRDDHLPVGEYLSGFVVPLVFDPDRPAAVEQDPAGLRVGNDLEVRAIHGRVQVGDSRTAPHPVPLGELVVADAVLLRAVEVVVRLVTGLLCRLEVGVHQRMAGPAV